MQGDESPQCSHGSQNQIHFDSFSISLPASGQLQYSWAGLDLPRVGNTFAVPWLPAESSSLGLAMAIATR